MDVVLCSGYAIYSECYEGIFQFWNALYPSDYNLLLWNCFAILLLKDYKDEYLSDKVIAFGKKYPMMIVACDYLKYTILCILIVWIGVLGGGQFIYFKF